MDFQEAKELLSSCKRSENRDHAFGDREIYWEKDGKEIGGGYFGNGEGSVWIGDEVVFKGKEADELVKCGSSVIIGRNDSTGPDTYSEGDVMPGLSKGDVFHELTGQYLDES